MITQTLIAANTPWTPVDPYFSYVKLLLHGEGSDGSTTITDSSGSANTVTANGGAQIDTAQSRWGSSSIYFDGTGDYLTVADSADFTFSSNFTIEMWIRYTLDGSAASYFGLFGKRADAASYGPVGAYVRGDGLVGFNISNTGSSWIASPVSSTGIVTSNTWAHIALTRTGNDFAMYINGTSRATHTSALSLVDNAVDFQIGVNNGAGSYAALGHIDDFRLTQGISRYSGASHAVPYYQFPDS